MTIILSGAALSLQTGTATTSVASLIGMSSGLVTTFLGNTVGTGAFSTGPGAAAGAASTGAILSAGITNTAMGSFVGGTVGALTSGVVNMCHGLALGPLGHLILGSNINSPNNGATYDCWKPIIHDNSEGKSEGKVFKEILTNPKVVGVTFQDGHLIVINIWNEQYRIEVVNLNSQISLHASRI